MTAKMKLPPVAALDDIKHAMALRQRTLKQLGKLTPELRQWVVEGLMDDMAAQEPDDAPVP